MPITIRDVQIERQRELNTREIKNRVFPATIVEVNGSVFPDTRPNFVWLKEYGDNATILAVYNDRVNPIAGLPVWVIESPVPSRRLEVWGVFTEQLSDSYGRLSSTFNIPLHGISHEQPTESTIGTDPVDIYQPAMQMLKTEGNGTLTVGTKPYIYHHDGVHYVFGGYNTDLTTYVPGTPNYVRKVLLYLDVVGNTLDVESGTAVLNTSPVPYPDIPVGGVPSAYITLANGQTTITTATDIEDARDLLRGWRTEQPYDATMVGDILISIDGITFERGKPVVDEWGEIVVDSTGTIVVI